MERLRILNGVLEWDLNQISTALKISPEDVRSYFTDGRRVSFMLERRLAFEVLHGQLAPSEGAGFDLYDAEGGKWEVRSITRGGIYFCPSYMVGKGRKFEEQGFIDKLDDIAGYILSDIELFPRIPYWMIPVSVVRGWWTSDQLGKNSNVSRVKALSLIGSI